WLWCWRPRHLLRNFVYGVTFLTNRPIPIRLFVTDRAQAEYPCIAVQLGDSKRNSVYAGCLDISRQSARDWIVEDKKDSQDPSKELGASLLTLFQDSSNLEP